MIFAASGKQQLTALATFQQNLYVETFRKVSNSDLTITFCCKHLAYTVLS